HRVIRREPHAVHEKLPLVERAEVAGLRVAETDHADELVVIRIGHRNGVRELLGGVDPVAMADWNIRVRCSARGLSGQGGGGEKPGEQACKRKKAAGHPVVSLVVSGAIHRLPWPDVGRGMVDAGTWVGAGSEGGSGSPTASFIAAISCCWVTII